jgi:putative transposase
MPDRLLHHGAQLLSLLPDTVSAVMRYTTFRFALDPTPAQAAMLARHAGASRFAYNQCLRLVTDAIRARVTDPLVIVPWSGFDLVNAFNAWKRSEAAGRIFVVSSDGCTVKQPTGLAWRQEVSAQVFAEAAVDLGRALAAYEEARRGERKGGRVGFPRRKRKGRCRDSFRLRNKRGRNGTAAIRVGEGNPRSVILPSIGAIRVHDDTRRLRRLLRPIAPCDQDAGIPMTAQRARILFATCSRHGARWYVSLNIEAPDFHPNAATHPARRRTMVDLSEWTAALASSLWRPLQPVAKSVASWHPSRSSRVWFAFAYDRVPRPALSLVLPTTPRRWGVCPNSTPAWPTSVDPFSTRSPSSSSRPTTGSA